MRADMSKLIVERPRCRRPKRAGSWYPRGSLKSAWYPDMEDAPVREGMGFGYAEKRLNENLRPLVRFLRSRVGRSWDKVYSEIAEHLRLTNAIQQHVIVHVRQFLDEHPMMIDGAPQRRQWHGGGWSWAPLVSIGMALRFYVCPRTRQLRLAPVVARKKRPAVTMDPDRRVLSPTRELRRFDGVWFEVDLGLPDVGGERAILRKRQLGTRAIELHGLRDTRRRT